MTDQNTAKISLPKINIPPCPVSEVVVDRNWRYELRHEAQEIVTGLWIGPLSILRNTSFLEQRGIRVLISVTDIRVIPVIMKQKYMVSPEYSCHSFDPGNKVTNPLAIVSQLSDICNLIKQAQDAGIATLIFCESGNEQSAVAAASYLIYTQHVNIIQAIQQVQAHRFSISLDDVSKHNLQTFHDLCLAHHQQASQNTDYTKRSREREDDDDDQPDLNDIANNKRQLR